MLMTSSIYVKRLLKYLQDFSVRLGILTWASSGVGISKLEYDMALEISASGAFEGMKK